MNTHPIDRESGEPAIKQQSLATRFVKTLAYWPFEDDHAEEGPTLAWMLVLTCAVLGIVISFQNVFLGIALAVACLFGSGLAAYLISR